MYDNTNIPLWIEFATVQSVKSTNANDIITLRLDSGESFALPANLVSAILGGDSISDETKRDLESEQYFSKGWIAALRETKLQRENGTLFMFLQESINMESDDEMAPPTEGEIAEHNKTQDAFEAMNLADSKMSISDLVPAYDEATTHKVVDSGEPEKEAMAAADERSRGNIVLALETYQDDMNGAYQRGVEEGLGIRAAVEKTAREQGYSEAALNGLAGERQTTKRTIDHIVKEIHNANGGSSPSSFMTAYTVARRLGYVIEGLDVFGTVNEAAAATAAGVYDTTNDGEEL